MCFSPEASFILGGGLLIAGTASVAKVRKPQEILFAGIPLIFGIQQLSEGIVWLGLIHEEYKNWGTPATYVFLFFAQVLWPTWVPLSFFVLEEHPKRKKILRILLLTGSVISGYLAFCLFHYPVHAAIQDHHIRYELEFPQHLRWPGAILYFMATVASPFISNIKGARLIGIFLLCSFLISKLFFKDYVISVWCFLAAAVSVLVVLKMRKRVPARE